MTRTVSRREFALAAAASVAAARGGAAAQAPAGAGKGTARPVVVASANGHLHRNGGARTCVETAFQMMTDRADVLDALIASVTLVELDPEDTSVGYGGFPNADGVIQLSSGAS